MVEILQNKNAATRFQIMVEIAASGPGIQQKSIAARLGVTPQAISDYIHQLVQDDMVLATGRSNYRVSARGVNWILTILRELHSYAALVEKAVTNITVCAAIAESDIKKGTTVGLKMKNGLLYATARAEGGATGRVLASVKKGEDTAVSDVEGLVELTRAKVTVLQIPVVQRGGSRQVDIDKLRAGLEGMDQVGAIGIEALASLRRAGTEPRYLYGVPEAAIEAAKCGLPFVVVCTEDAVSGLIKRLQEGDLDYELVDLKLAGGS